MLLHFSLYLSYQADDLFNHTLCWEDGWFQGLFSDAAGIKHSSVVDVICFLLSYPSHERREERLCKAKTSSHPIVFNSVCSQSQVRPKAEENEIYFLSSCR
ncbi:hypothetical protein Dimus_014011 [Dionaea muscipula]